MLATTWITLLLCLMVLGLACWYISRNRLKTPPKVWSAEELDLLGRQTNHHIHTCINPHARTVAGPLPTGFWASRPAGCPDSTRQQCLVHPQYCPLYRELEVTEGAPCE